MLGSDSEEDNLTCSDLARLDGLDDDVRPGQVEATCTKDHRWAYNANLSVSQSRPCRFPAALNVESGRSGLQTIVRVRPHTWANQLVGIVLDIPATHVHAWRLAVWL